jgi:hypothetical protein
MRATVRRKLSGVEVLMRRAGVLFVFIVAGGCATPAEVRMNADMHVEKANARAANRDYVGAQKEMDKAHQQYDKALRRSYGESYWF